MNLILRLCSSREAADKAISKALHSPSNDDASN